MDSSTFHIVIIVLLVVIVAGMIFMAIQCNKNKCNCNKEKYSKEQRNELENAHGSTRPPLPACPGCGVDLPFQPSSLYDPKKDDRVARDFGDL